MCEEKTTNGEKKLDNVVLDTTSVHFVYAHQVLQLWHSHLQRESYAKVGANMTEMV